MHRTRQLLLPALFLAIIFAVPVSQAILDVTVEGEERPYAVTVVTRAPSEKNLRDFEDNLERSSYYEQKVRPLFQVARLRLLDELGEKAQRGRAPGWLFYTPGVHYLTEPYYRDLLEPPEHDPVAVIADFARQLRGRGIALLVVPVPGKPTVHPERLVSGVQAGPAVAAHTKRLIGELRARGVAVLDLHRALLAAREARPGQALYMERDTHWTGTGARLAAEAVAAWIKERPWYREPQQRRYSRREVQVRRHGDIPRMTRIPRYKERFSDQRVTCYQVRLARGEDAGELYMEPDEPAESPVLVLGDSFSRVFELDEPEAAGWVSNLAFELQTPVAAIINDGGASTLVRQQLARDLTALEGKKLVVWAFVERDVRFGMQGWQPIELWPER